MSIDGSTGGWCAGVEQPVRYPQIDYFRSYTQNPAGSLLVRYADNQHVGTIIVTARLVNEDPCLIAPVSVRVLAGRLLPVPKVGLKKSPELGLYLVTVSKMATVAMAEDAFGRWISHVLPYHRRPHNGLFDQPVYGNAA